MRALSEPIARMANRQDECTGRFWEGRFKALRIVDEAGLLACSMYVDLNPVRAAMVAEPEQAVHTSVYDRLQGEQGGLIDSAAFDLVPVSTEEAGKAIRETPVEQLKQQRSAKKRNPTGRKIRRWTAKQAIDAVVAKMPTKLATLLASLGIDSTMWRDLVWNFKKYFGRGSCVGSPSAMAEDAQRSGRHWHRGQKTARSFFAAAPA